MIDTIVLMTYRNLKLPGRAVALSLGVFLSGPPEAAQRITLSETDGIVVAADVSRELPKRAPLPRIS